MKKPILISGVIALVLILSFCCIGTMASHKTTTTSAVIVTMTVLPTATIEVPVLLPTLSPVPTDVPTPTLLSAEVIAQAKKDDATATQWWKNARATATYDALHPDPTKTILTDRSKIIKSAGFISKGYSSQYIAGTEYANVDRTILILDADDGSFTIEMSLDASDADITQWSVVMVLSFPKSVIQWISYQLKNNGTEILFSGGVNNTLDGYYIVIAPAVEPSFTGSGDNAIAILIDPQ